MGNTQMQGLENDTKNMRKLKYPGIKEAERERSKKHYIPEEPDFIAGAPNYEKFKNWKPEKIMVWLNID